LLAREHVLRAYGQFEDWYMEMAQPKRSTPVTVEHGGSVPAAVNKMNAAR
jgi:hypothetical protein